MGDQTFPSADEQISVRLQNALHNVLLEIASQGTDVATINGSYSVTVVNGEISVSKTEEAGSRRKPTPTPTSD